MLERIGLIVKAAEEKAKSGATVFRVGIRVKGEDYEYTLFDTAHIATAKDLKDKMAKIVSSKKGQYWNVESIEPATEEDTSKPDSEGNGRDKAIAVQVATKVTAELWIYDKLRETSPEVIDMRAWLCHQFAPFVKGGIAKYPSTKEEVAPEDDAWKKTVVGRLNEFKRECLRFGWDGNTDEGALRIKEWLEKQHGTGARWENLKIPTQIDAVALMHQEADEELPFQEPFSEAGG